MKRVRHKRLSKRTTKSSTKTNKSSVRKFFIFSTVFSVVALFVSVFSLLSINNANFQVLGASTVKPGTLCYSDSTCAQNQFCDGAYTFGFYHHSGQCRTVSCAGMLQHACLNQRYCTLVPPTTNHPHICTTSNYQCNPLTFGVCGVKPILPHGTGGLRAF